MLPWDQIAVWVIVAAAAAYLGRDWVRKRRAGGCGGCAAACKPPPTAKPEPPHLIQLEAPPREPRSPASP